MIEPGTHRRLAGNRKKRPVPLAKLRTAEVVRTVVDHPRRIQELVTMLEDKDRQVRGRAAATLARLAETHTRRLLPILERIRGAFSDESAYVRWHLAYAFGRIGSRFPARSDAFNSELVSRLDDENRIVRGFVSDALVRIAAETPKAVEEIFHSGKREIPARIAQVLKEKQGNSSSAR